MRILSCLAASSLLVLSALAGCSSESSSSSSSSSSSGGAADGGADTGPIGCLADGLLKVTISGLPAGLVPKVNIAGSAKTTDIAENKDLTLPAGDYKIKAADVATTGDTVARTLYRATVSPATTKLCSGPVTVTVTYAAVGSSGKVWSANQNGEAAVLGWAPATIAASGAVAASVSSKTNGGRGMAFDKEGNLWTIGGTTADKTLGRYPAASLAASGEPAPDREIGIANTGCSPLASAAAFDKDGNLWVSLLCEKKIVRLTPANLAASGDVTPAVAISNVEVPKGLAFDKDGNLYVSDDVLNDAKVKRFDASRLGASIDATASPPNATLSLAEGSEHLAFDFDGHLWSVGGSAINLTKLSKNDLGTTGTPTPLTTISIGVNALPEGLAFDETSGLWIAGSGGQFVRLGPGQLNQSSTAADPTPPERVISSSDIGSASDIAIFPAPAGLPLYHRAD